MVPQEPAAVGNVASCPVLAGTRSYRELGNEHPAKLWRLWTAANGAPAHSLHSPTTTAAVPLRQGLPNGQRVAISTASAVHTLGRTARRAALRGDGPAYRDNESLVHFEAHVAPVNSDQSSIQPVHRRPRCS
jgi:hypothetical protein